MEGKPCNAEKKRQGPRGALATQGCVHRRDGMGPGGDGTCSGRCRQEPAGHGAPSRPTAPARLQAASPPAGKPSQCAPWKQFQLRVKRFLVISLPWLFILGAYLHRNWRSAPWLIIHPNPISCIWPPPPAGARRQLQANSSRSWGWALHTPWDRPCLPPGCFQLCPPVPQAGDTNTCPCGTLHCTQKLGAWKEAHYQQLRVEEAQNREPSCCTPRCPCRSLPSKLGFVLEPYVGEALPLRLLLACEGKMSERAILLFPFLCGCIVLLVKEISAKRSLVLPVSPGSRGWDRGLPFASATPSQGAPAAPSPHTGTAAGTRCQLGNKTARRLFALPSHQRGPCLNPSVFSLEEKGKDWFLLIASHPTRSKPCKKP